jgi:hypothetical protein
MQNDVVPNNVHSSQASVAPSSCFRRKRTNSEVDKPQHQREEEQAQTSKKPKQKNPTPLEDQVLYSQHFIFLVTYEWA